MLSLASRFNSKLTKQWVEYFLLLRISRYRLGRYDFLDIGGGLSDVGREKAKKRRLRDLFAGFS